MSQIEQSSQKQDFLQDASIACQPIYNRQLGIYAYELLSLTSQSMSADQSAADILVNIFADSEFAALVGQRLISINVSEWYLDKLLEFPIPQDKVIIEISADYDISDTLMDAIQTLKKTGFQFAVDNYIYDTSLSEALSLFDMVKIDVNAISSEQLPLLISDLKKYKNLSFLALNISNIQDLSIYQDLGFDYCQGNVMTKPRVYSSKNLSGSKLLIMSLLSVLYKADFDFDETEKIISQDVAVSYKLLKLINTPFFGISQTIESVHQALVILGRDKLRNWVTILALSSMDDCPLALIELTVVRAKMCELLAKAANESGVESFFTVGLFSALDILLQKPLEALLGELPLSEAIKSAILHNEGPMGQALQCTVACERGDWQQAQFQQLDSSAISKVSYEAFRWSMGLMQSV